jgi:hypothetical protein
MSAADTIANVAGVGVGVLESFIYAKVMQQVPESTVAAIKQGQFQTNPGAQKESPTEPDSPTYHPNPPDKSYAGERSNAKALVDATAKSGVGGSIFFRRKANFSVGASLGVVDFDLILDEETTYRAQVCQHPVQSGDPITDHIQALPPSGRLKVLVSNYSLKYANGGAHSGEWAASQNRAMAAYETLKGLMRGRSEVALVTTLEDFSAVNNYVVLTRLTTPKKAEDGDSLTFEIEYTQIYKISRLKTTNLPVVLRVKDMTDAKNRTAASAVSTGTQSPRVEAMPENDQLSTDGT